MRRMISSWSRRLTLPLLLALGVVYTPVRANAPSTALPVSKAGPSVSQALNPDGTLRSGVSGTFDATGYRMVTDPASGQPAFRPASPQGPGDQNWQNGFGLPGPNGSVLAIAAVGNGDVYIGGDFTAIGTVSANYVAKWNGTTWSALGTGVNGTVNALAVLGSNVYVGGSFSTAGGVAVSRVAKWNGTAWSALGAGLNGPIYALAASGSELYVGGGFTTAGGIAANYVARWNGTAWSALGAGVNSNVLALAVSGSNVYAGVTQPGSTVNNYVAKWDGSTWSTLGTVGGVRFPQITALAVLGPDLYAGGSFNSFGNYNIAKWNGTTWSPVGAGVYEYNISAPFPYGGVVFAMTVLGSDLYVGGIFNTAGGAPIKNIAKWNGSTWSSLGTGLDNRVMAMGTLGSAVLAGGDFTMVGDSSKVTARFGIYHTVAPPTITSFTPASGPVGTSVTVTGTNLTGATAVTVNGTAGTITGTPTATNLTFTVSAGTTTGLVRITTPGGTATSSTSFVSCGSPQAPAGFTYLGAMNGKAIYLSTGTATWTAAQAACVAAGGNLVTIPDAATNTFLLNATGGAACWIGLNDAAAEGTYRWVSTNAVVTYFNWASSQPDNYTGCGAATGEDYGTIYNGGWNDADNNNCSPMYPLPRYLLELPACSVPPTIASFTPAAGAAVGATVTLTGTNFTGATSVKFNGAAATSFTVSSATSITATVPATATTGKLGVTTPGGTALSAGTFKVLPAISGFTPAFAAPGALVTITGSGFTGATVVKFYTVTAPSFMVVNATTITATVPATAVSGKLYVTTAGGTATSAGTFYVTPTISSFTPAQGSPGSVVLVTGLNFTSTTSVAFNGVNAVKTYNSATQLTATVPAGATTGKVSVANAYGTSASATNYTVTSGAIPTISSFAPTANVMAGTLVTITGTNFTGATLVRFNNVNAASFTLLSATQVRAAVPAGALTGKVYVATPNGMAQSAASLTIIAPPTVSSFAPTSGAPGAMTLIAGANLTNASSVKFNGVNATSFTVNSAAQIAAYVPAGATTGKVTVTTPAGTATSAANFTVLAGPAPTITSLSPATGVRGSSVVVRGTNFTGVTAVKVGTSTVAAGAFTVNSATQLTLTVPATAVTGRVFITTSGGGMAQSPGDYTVILPPTISSFTPASGAVGTLVTINGTNLTGASAVRFGGVAVTSYTVVSAAKITATVPAGAVTGPLQVTTVAGTATSAATFTVTGPRPAAVTGGTAGTGAPVEMTVYPNPARAWVGIEVRHLPTRTASAELLDGLGRVVRTVTVSEGYTRVTLANLVPGVYAVRVGVTTKRLVVE